MIDPAPSPIHASIEALTGIIEAHGYIVVMEPVPGMEGAFREALRHALGTITAVMVFNEHRFDYRGRSKAALTALHRDLPEPGWGIEIRN